MKMRRIQPAQTALLVLGTILLVLVLGGGTYVVHKHQWAQTRLDEIQPRYARILGLMEGERQLAAMADQQSRTLNQWVYPPEQDATQVGNGALQRLREILTTAGCQVLSSQVLPVREDVPGFERIPLGVRIEGSLASIQQALAAIDAQSPIMVPDSVNVQPNQFVRNADAAPIAVTLSVSVLRRRP